MSHDFDVHEWATTHSSACVHGRTGSCVARRVLDIAACAHWCTSVANCSHASAVVRPRASTWCYPRVGEATWISFARCQQRLALKSVLKPVVIVMRGRCEVRWPDLTEKQYRERHNCSAFATEAQLHAQRHAQQQLPHPKDGIDVAYAKFCGPVGVLRPWPSDAVKARLVSLASAGFTQRRMGPSTNIARSRVAMRCYYHLTRLAARQIMREHQRASPHKPRRLVACEIGFSAGHSAILLLSALEAESRRSKPKARALVSYLGFDLGDNDWTRRAAHLLNTSSSMNFVGRVRLVLGNSNQTAPLALRAADNGIGAPLCDVLSMDGESTAVAVVNDWRNFRHSLSPSAVIFVNDVDEYHPVWAEPGLQRVGCTSLSGVADDKLRALPMSAAETFCVAVREGHELSCRIGPDDERVIQHQCISRGVGCSSNAMPVEAGDSEWGERAVAHRFSGRCKRVLEIGGGSGSVSSVIQSIIPNKTRHVVVQPAVGGMMGGYQQLVKIKNVSRLRFHTIDHVLRMGEGREVIKILSGQPDCIVADCEDCLWEEYTKNEELFSAVQQIQVERDDKEQNYISLFEKLKMKKIHTGRGCGVHLPNKFHKKNGILCTTEVWERKGSES